MQIADVSNDRKVVAELTLHLKRAATEREELRRLIKEHEGIRQAEAPNAVPAQMNR